MSLKKTTFKVVQSSAENGGLIFERVFKPAESQTRIPDELLRTIDPSVFGVHHSLPDCRIREICRAIYGVSEIPLPLKQQLDAERAAAKAKHDKAQENEREMLENDMTYFPLDGYDYEQHLAPIHGSVVPSLEVDPADFERPLPPKPVKELLNQAALDAPAWETLTPEEKEAVRALEESSENGELDDDFVQTAGGTGLLDDPAFARDLLWGGWVPELVTGSQVSAKEKEAISEFLLQRRKQELENHYEIEEFTDEEAEEDLDVLEDILKILDEDSLEDDDPRLCGGSEKINLETVAKDLKLLQPKSEKVALADPGIGLPTPPPGMSIHVKACDRAHVDVLTATVDGDTKAKILELEKRLTKESEVTNHDKIIQEMKKYPEREKWDCETIQSFSSNLYNHPRKIAINPSMLKKKCRT